MLKVFAQTAIAPQPAEGPFDDPAARQHLEALAAFRAPHDFQSPTVGLLDPRHNVFIRAIGPDELQTTPSVVEAALDVLEQCLQSALAAIPVGHTRAVHHDEPQQTEGIHHNMAFSPADLLVHIHAALFATFGGLDALAINNRRARSGLPSFTRADGFDQDGIDLVPHALIAPLPIVAIDRLPRRKVMRHQPPRTAAPENIEDGA